MSWFKREELGFCVSYIDQKHESLIKEVQNMRAGLESLENQIADLKLELWMYKTIAPKVEYRILFRQPKNYLSGYHKECAELEAKGWHIKRVSDCGKYEIWMPLPELPK
jgi:hypothetical protein